MREVARRYPLAADFFGCLLRRSSQKPYLGGQCIELSEGDVQELVYPAIASAAVAKYRHAIVQWSHVETTQPGKVEGESLAIV